MNYRGKKIAITGATGFIGNALAKEFALMPDGPKHVEIITGDIRDRRTFDVLDHTYDYLFHFAAPSSQVQFKRQPAFSIKTTILGFMNAADIAKRHGIRFVYPSTGLLSSDQKPNEYALCKRMGELYVQGKGMDAIGLRIFATYGPGEGHKRDYASVPYLFARDIVDGKRPEIYGDGKQVRDFIYIGDVVNSILILAEECSDPIVDIGSGKQTSFLQIMDAIAAVSTIGEIKGPKFIDRPTGYVQETAADPTRLHDFYTPQTSFEYGIELLVNHLRGVR